VDDLVDDLPFDEDFLDDEVEVDEVEEVGKKSDYFS
jgi:hypothetical protein